MKHVINPASLRCNRYDFPASAHAAVGQAVRPLTADPEIAKELSSGLGPNKSGGFHIIVDPAGTLGQTVAALAAEHGATVTERVC